MSFKKILVPYDASSYANHAFDEALKIAEKFDSKITVLTILEKTVEQPTGISLDRAIEIQDEHENVATKILKDLESLAKEKHVDFSFKVIHDPSPYKGIVNFSNSNSMDLIVMGSHGRRGIKKALLGSVASGVVEHANCPVLIIKKMS
ncbi:MAG: universal stress protein [Nitrosopumilaceae archaeon]